MRYNPRLLTFAGWSYDHRFWLPLQRALPELSFVAAGAVAGGSERAISEPVIVVAHSYGMMRWLRDSADLNVAGWISINGFSRFCAGDDFVPGVPRRMLDRMLKKCSSGEDKDDSVATLQVVNDFRLRCGGLPLDEPLSSAQQNDLVRELLDMRDGDRRAVLDSISKPGLVLADRRDQIVTESMTRALFSEHGNNVQTGWHDSESEHAVHFLPQIAPEWCASNIREFLAGTDFE